MKKYIILISIAALAFYACDKQDSGTTRNEGSITELEVTVPEFEDSEGVKTTVDRDGNFSWVVGDQLGFIPSPDEFPDGKQVKFRISSANENSAIFTSDGWGLFRGSKYYSYYPYDGGNSPTSVSVDYTGQRQVANSSTAHLGAYDYLHAGFDVPTSGNLNVTFRHIGAIARFELVIPDGYQTYSFDSLEFKSSENIFLKSGVYNPAQDFDASGASGEIVSFSSTAKSNIFMMDLGAAGGSGILCDQSTRVLEVFVMMSPTAWKDKKIDVTLYSKNLDTSIKKFTGSFTPTKNQAPSSRYRYSSNISSDERIDLSADETANCYIIDHAGKYKFRANIKGNGVAASTEATTFATPVSAYLYWESTCTGTAPARHTLVKAENFSYNSEDGYVYFETSDTFTPGIAAISVLNDWSGTGSTAEPSSYYNCRQNALWTWYLWFVEGVSDDTYANNIVFMDRNLGALSKEAGNNLSIGALIEWGRPTFMLGASQVGQTNRVRARFLSDNSLYPADETVPTQSQGVLTGHYFAIDVLKWPVQYSAGDTDLRHWAKDDFRGNYWQDSKKTMYDPCPPGYRVPPLSSFANMAKDSAVTGGLKIKIGSGSSFYWPLTGLIGLHYTNVLENVSTSAQYWSSQSATFTSGGNTGHTGRTMDMDESSIKNVAGQSWSVSGNPVRCQKIIQ